MIQTLTEQYEDLGIKTIAIVDDSNEHLARIEEAIANIDGVSTKTFTSARSIIDEFKDLDDVRPEFQLVISDLRMETPTAGIDVMRDIFSKGVAGIIVTGGKGHDGDIVQLFDPMPTILENVQNKTDVNTWSQVLEHVSNDTVVRQLIRTTSRASIESINTVLETRMMIFTEMIRQHTSVS